MTTFTKLSLLAAALTTTMVTQAGAVRGYVRSNGTYVAAHSTSTGGPARSATASGYVYRNPFAAPATVPVREYIRDNGTVVLPHLRTPANDTLTDNLSYRGLGTVRVPTPIAQEMKPQPLPLSNR